MVLRPWHMQSTTDCYFIQWDHYVFGPFPPPPPEIAKPQCHVCRNLLREVSWMGGNFMERGKKSDNGKKNVTVSKALLVTQTWKFKYGQCVLWDSLSYKYLLHYYFHLNYIMLHPIPRFDLCNVMERYEPITSWSTKWYRTLNSYYQLIYSTEEYILPIKWFY